MKTTTTKKNEASRLNHFTTHRTDKVDNYENYFFRFVAAHSVNSITSKVIRTNRSCNIV